MCTPRSRAVSMQAVQTAGSVRVQLCEPLRRVESEDLGHCAQVGSGSLVVSHPPSCVPSLHRHYPASTLLWTL